MTDLEQIDQLLTARHPCLAVSTFEEDYVLGLLREAAVERGWDLWLWSVTRGLSDGLLADSPPVLNSEHPAAALYHVANQQPHKAAVYAFVDLADHLKDGRTLRLLREAVERLGRTGGTLALIDHVEELPAVVAALATRVQVSFPEEPEVEQIVKETIRHVNQDTRIEVHLHRAELQTIVRNLRGLSRRQVRQVILDSVCCDRRFDASDLQIVLARKRRALSGAGPLEFVEAPVSLNEVGGLGRLKQWLGVRRDCLSDEAAAFGLTPPRGMLLLGVQGAGKSLSAKAVATAWQRPLLRLDAGSLYEKFIGESERHLREALRQAEMMAPVVLWIDEIEKGFASAASQSSDGGLSKRMFGALLTWMQEHRASVFLVATANDIEALPPELLRKGRFDEIFFVDLPGLEARHAIFEIHLARRKRDPGQFDLAALCEASDGYSGAEIEQAIVGALYDAFAAKAELTTRHVLAALKNSPPLSVTMAEKVAELREWSAGRCVPAE
jgi:ATP-dependent 26S proteasome regulatory subunit